VVPRTDFYDDHVMNEPVMSLTFMFRGAYIREYNPSSPSREKEKYRLVSFQGYKYEKHAGKLDLQGQNK
jgi:hypothetical protein